MADQPITASTVISAEMMAKIEETAKQVGLGADDLIARMIEREVAARVDEHMRRFFDGETR